VVERGRHLYKNSLVVERGRHLYKNSLVVERGRHLYKNRLELGSQRWNSASALKASDTLADVGEGEPTRQRANGASALKACDTLLGKRKEQRSSYGYWRKSKRCSSFGERGRHLYKNSMEEERERSLCWEHATLSRWMKRERGRHLYKNRSGRKREKTRPLQEASDTPK
jgi:hypothetical protein